MKIKVYKQKCNGLYAVLYRTNNGGWICVNKNMTKSEAEKSASAITMLFSLQQNNIVEI